LSRLPCGASKAWGFTITSTVPENAGDGRNSLDDPLSQAHDLFFFRRLSQYFSSVLIGCGVPVFAGVVSCLSMFVLVGKVPVKENGSLDEKGYGFVCLLIILTDAKHRSFFVREILVS
jgi:hypothetical protein